MSKMRGNIAKFKCRTCSHINMVVKNSPSDSNDFNHELINLLSHENDKEQQPRKKFTTNTTLTKIKGIGLRTKMMVLFIIIPVFLMATASFFYLNKMRELSELLTGDSSNMVTEMAEQIIIEKGRAVAREVKLYLKTHPNLKKEDFNKTPELVEIAMQKVGETGYTLIIERETANHPEYMWVHPNEKLIGIDITGAMKAKLGDKWERWNSVRSKSYETNGYYLWFDNREKYVAGIPIEGTPFNIASSTYIDEFSQPVEEMKKRAKSMTDAIMRIVICILGTAAILIALITFVYGNHVSGKIKRLTDVTDRISMGELDAKVPMSSRDEIGALAEAIIRMQNSISISIERLRRRGR
jgi:HAMP domain-containing protein